MLDFREWHVENCKNVVVVYDGGFRCTDNLSCIHDYAEYRVKEANRWRKWPKEKPEKFTRVLVKIKFDKVIAEFVPSRTVTADEYLSDEARDAWPDMEDYDEKADTVWVVEGFFEYNNQSDMTYLIDMDDIIAWQPLPEYKEQP